MAINRVKYLNKARQDSHFEIVTIERFYATRPKAYLEKDFRLDFWSMIYITKGSGVHSIDFYEYRFKAGDLIVLAKNQIHSFRVNFSIEGYIININSPFFIDNAQNYDTDMLAFFEAPYRKPILHVDISKNTSSRQLMDLIYKEYLNNGTNMNKLIKSLFAAFIYAIRHENSSTIKTLSAPIYMHYYEYRELVENNYKQIKTVTEYAAVMCLNKKTINHACRECAGISAKELIVNRIILEAKRLIIQDKLKNFEISDELGFDEPANLAGFFKRYTGLSMREFKGKLK